MYQSVADVIEFNCHQEASCCYWESTDSKGLKFWSQAVMEKWFFSRRFLHGLFIMISFFVAKQNKTKNKKKFFLISMVNPYLFFLLLVSSDELANTTTIRRIHYVFSARQLEIVPFHVMYSSNRLFPANNASFSNRMTQFNIFKHKERGFTEKSWRLVLEKSIKEIIWYNKRFADRDIRNEFFCFRFSDRLEFLSKPYSIWPPKFHRNSRTFNSRFCTSSSSSSVDGSELSIIQEVLQTLSFINRPCTFPYALPILVSILHSLDSACSNVQILNSSQDKVGSGLFSKVAFKSGIK